MNTTTQRGVRPWLFAEVSLNVCAPCPLGNVRLEKALAVNVQAILDFSYTPADIDAPAEAAIRSAKLVQDARFEGKFFTTTCAAGFDLLELLSEIEVERLEEMIIARAEKKGAA